MGGLPCSNRIALTAPSVLGQIILPTPPLQPCLLPYKLPACPAACMPCCPTFVCWTPSMLTVSRLLRLLPVCAPRPAP
jgi:hypothetical protein